MSRRKRIRTMRRVLREHGSPVPKRGCLGALLLVLVLVLVLTVGCSAPTGQHWPRSSGTETVVYLVVPLDAPTDVRNATERTARDWSAAAGLTVRMINAPQPGQNNATIEHDPAMGPGHGNTWRAASGLVITGAGVTVGSAGTLVPTPDVQNAVCHEVGHVFGLTHGIGPGPCEAGHPTSWDLTLIGQAYGGTDPAGPPGI